MARIALSYRHYPLSVARFFRRAFMALGHEVCTIGPFEPTIPWQPNTDYSAYWDIPDIEIFPEGDGGSYPMAQARAQGLEAWKPDALVMIDAAFHLSGGWPKVPIALVATDPHCVSGDTLLATDHGIVRADEIHEDHESIHVCDKTGMVGSMGGVICTGYKPVRKLILETGQSLICTDDHHIETPSGDFVRADMLAVGDEVLLACGTYDPGFGLEPEREYAIGFVLGAFQGDGCFGRKDFVKFTLHRERKAAVVEALREHLLVGFGIDHVTMCDHRESENTVIMQIRRWGLYDFLKRLDLKGGHVPPFVRKGSRHLLGGYLAGLLATDGCCSEGRLQFSTKWERLAHELQTILFYLGVPTSLASRTDAPGSYKPNAWLYTLYIRTGEGTSRLAELTGEIPNKPFRAKTRRRGVADGTVQAFQIVAIEGAVKNYPHKRVLEPVYDVLNTDNGSFLANGISVHNCIGYSETAKSVNAFLVMQETYMRQYVPHGGQTGMWPPPEWLPYCYSPEVHYWTPGVEPEYDVCFVGVLYPERQRMLRALQDAGLKVLSAQGVLYEEGTALYAKAKVALNLSSRLDLPMRFWEGLAYRRLVFTNRVPDLALLEPWGCHPYTHYIPFDAEYSEGDSWVRPNLDDLIAKLRLYCGPAWEEEGRAIADAGYVFVQPHTYQARAKQILRALGVK
jgi:hypothetical protein